RPQVQSGRPVQPSGTNCPRHPVGRNKESPAASGELFSTGWFQRGAWGRLPAGSSSTASAVRLS
ncbi:MAG: hypothetical protein K2J63_10805, partial [Muribaculaceae bacterium]|nr:hypothetical protein [Muribaculaceae bacterium]